MADRSDSRESDNNNWVIAGSEALAVEELRPEAAEETRSGAEPGNEGTQAPLAASKLPSDQPDPEDTQGKVDLQHLVEAELAAICAETPIPGLAKTSQAESDILPQEETDGHEAKARPTPDKQGTLRIHKTGPLGEQAGISSSEEEESAKERDVEGLRRRKGLHTPPAALGAPQAQHRQEDTSSSGTKWLLGLAALLGLAILAFSGVVFEQENGPVGRLSTRPGSDSKELPPSTNGQDWLDLLPPEPVGDAKLQKAKEAPPPERPPSDGQSLDAMGLLLDKLAKENQGIRLLQADLQAQKEELQTLLRKTEGESLEFTSQQQNLAAENARLTESLQRETSALLAAQAELRFLREKLDKVGNGRPQQQRRWEDEPMPKRHHDKAGQPEAEIPRLRSLLESVQHDLGKALQKVPLADGLRTELQNMERRLARELDHTAAVMEGARPLWRGSSKAKRDKERMGHKRHEGQEGETKPTKPQEETPAKDHKDPHWGHKPTKAADSSLHRPRKHKGSQDTKPGKDRAHQRGGRKARKPSEPGALWEMLAQHQYQAPQDCSGIVECAHQEGLAPVQKAGFLQMVQSYLAGLGWEEHYGGLAAALDAFFRDNGTFAHDRLSFVDFLDEVEDALEEVAQHLGADDAIVDDFEEVILKQHGVGPGARFAQRAPTQRQPKERHSRKNGRGSSSQSYG